ncbi:4726_t:CDS:2 [Ambispora gerdemannii]|uniref:5-hydroxyisourate hydrolase n=1 Tax=Ambispora gerdemannii TaxID=144530 RepID=A0A9N8V1H9_9GLOM|nr:4726_t:CDS:2 [Ambispora gerdemannii]
MSQKQQSPITCHVLDTSRGEPAEMLPIRLEVKKAPTTSPEEYDKDWILVAEGETNKDGRCPNLLSPESHKITRGIYRITFNTSSYFDNFEVETFYPYVQVIFSITDTEGHYHVPLILSPYSYTTYRGS